MDKGVFYNLLIARRGWRWTRWMTMKWGCPSAQYFSTLLYFKFNQSFPGFGPPARPWRMAHGGRASLEGYLDI